MRKRGENCKREETEETHPAGVSSCSEYRRLTLSPCFAIASTASSETDAPSVVARILMMRRISSDAYPVVGITSRRARKSDGMPCAATRSSEPRMAHMPRFDARITMGTMGDSSARFR